MTETRRTVPGPRRNLRWGPLFGALGAILVAVIATALFVASGGCDPEVRRVVVYAAQDRIFAEPVFKAFEMKTGIRVRAVYDSEATKTAGLANRLLMEVGQPSADVWWSNEELRTRMLVGKGVLAGDWRSFGERRRVLVIRDGQSHEALRDFVPSLAALTNAAFQGQVALAYPVFGTTTTHFLALRQRWGEEAWKNWCQALILNRPFVVDGNSVVVRLVARGDVLVGLTDSDDAAYALREGLSIRVLDLPSGDGLAIPNTVGRVASSAWRDEAETLIEYLCGEDVRNALNRSGALIAGKDETGGGAMLTDTQWKRLLDEQDAALEWLREVFVR